MNKGIYKGTFCIAPEMRMTQDGQTMIVRFRLAIGRKFKREGEPDADFISCVAFGKNAENIYKFFDKGSQILITARVQTGSYTNNEGRKVYTTEFVVEEWEFCGPAKTEKTTEEPKKGTEKPQFVPAGDDHLPWD